MLLRAVLSAALLPPALLLLVASLARAEGARVDLLGRETVRDVRIAGISGGALRWFDRKKEVGRADLDDLVSITFGREVRSVGTFEPREVEVLLRNGDVVRGSLDPAEQDRVAVSSPLLGTLDWPVETVREIRFLDAWSKVVEKPVLAGDSPDLDLFYYRSLDHVEGTYSKTTLREVTVQRSSGGSQSVGFSDLLVIRFAELEEPPPEKGRLAVLLLVDGSRITARRITSDGRKLMAKTLRGREVEVAFDDVVSLIMKGGRFVYLSDLEPSDSEFVPWLGDSYAWDRPRWDRSFLDRPLRAGAETFVKGIGVISGTTLTWKLDGAYRVFTSLVALDDAAGDEGDVVFEILVDGESRYESDVLRRLPGDERPLRVPDIDLTDAKELTLRVKWVDDYVMDFADWIEPMLIR